METDGQERGGNLKEKTYDTALHKKKTRGPFRLGGEDLLCFVEDERAVRGSLYSG